MAQRCLRLAGGLWYRPGRQTVSDAGAPLGGYRQTPSRRASIQQITEVVRPNTARSRASTSEEGDDEPLDPESAAFEDGGVAAAAATIETGHEALAVSVVAVIVWSPVRVAGTVYATVNEPSASAVT